MVTSRLLSFLEDYSLRGMELHGVYELLCPGVNGRPFGGSSDLRDVLYVPGKILVKE